MSTGINIAPSSDLTVGTTPVTSGTDGRVFFQAGGVVQQDANFTFDNTLKRLTLKAVNTGPSDIPLVVRNSADTANLMQVAGNNATTFYQYNTGTLNSFNILNVNSDTASRLDVGDVATGNYLSFIQTKAVSGGGGVVATATFRSFLYSNNVNGNNLVISAGDGMAFSAQAPSGYVSTSDQMRLKNGNLSIGTGYTGTARLDVRAADGLPNLAFRVRNSINSADLFYTLGNGTTGIPWGDSFKFTYGDTNLGADIIKNGQFGTRIKINYFGNAYTFMDENGFATFGNLSVGSNIITSYRVFSSTGFGTEADHILLSQPQNGTRKASMLFSTNYSAGVSYNTARLQVETYVANSVDRTKFNFWATNGGFNIAPTIIGSLTCKSNLLLGTPTEDINDSNTLYIPNGTAPTTSIANGGKLYVEAGALRYRDVNGDITNAGGTVQAVASAATVTPVYTNKFVKITAQAAALTLANPTGTWAEGQDLMIRIKDDGLGARAITWDTNYRAIGVTLPTTTVLGKTTYVGVIYNSDDGKWDVIGVTTEA